MPEPIEARLPSSADVSGQGIPDERLLTAFAAGDAAAFALLYDRHARATWRFVRHRLGSANQAAAEAVLEAGWIEAARSGRRIPAGTAWTPWLYGIVRGQTISHLDSPSASPDDALPAQARPTPASGPKAMAESFLSALARLPAPAREVAVLRMDAGLEPAGIAQVIAEPLRAVQARMFGGLGRLAEVVGVRDTDIAEIARAYRQAWALCDEKSRWPSPRIRERALAAAMQAAATGPKPPSASRAHEEQAAFAAEVDAALAGALTDDAGHQKRRPDRQAFPQGLPDAGAGHRQEPIQGETRRPPPRPRTAWRTRFVTVTILAAAAGVGGWQMRDKLGPDIGRLLNSPPEPATAGAQHTDQRLRADEALARAEAALSQGTAAPASAPEVATAEAAPASVPTLEYQPASTAAPAMQGASSATPAPLPAGSDMPASAQTPQTLAASPRRIQARPRPDRNDEDKPVFDAASAIAAAQARADAFLDDPTALPARPSAHEGGEPSRAARIKASAASEAARARADAYLSDRGPSPAH